MSKFDFSVIITTRNRPEMFETALKSVIAQKDASFEVVVVNDGSEENFLPLYAELEAKYVSGVTFVYLIQSMTGHGPCYAANQGVLHASGDYVAFLDDDDVWQDEFHLKKAKQTFDMEDKNPVLYFTRQAAWLKENKLTGPIWLERNLAALEKNPTKTPSVYYAYRKDLTANGAFAHVNNTIIKRAFFLEIKGFDEDIRYEGDREFFLRAVDVADSILFADRCISRHYVPDPDQEVNISTLIKALNRLQYQSYLYSKLYVAAKSSEVREVARQGYGYSLKNLTMELIKQGKLSEARHYGGMALMAQFSIKWLGFYIYLSLRSVVGR